MRVFFVACSAYILAVCWARPNSHNSRNPRDISDECRPPFLRPHQSSREDAEKGPPICCEMPEIVTFTPEAFVKCQEMVMHNGPPRGGPRGIHRSGVHKILEKLTDKRTDTNHDEPPPPPDSSAFQERKECMANCLFNVSGYLNSDEMINEEILNMRLLEEVANNTQWTSTADPVFKKCIAAAKEANSQSQKSCKPAAAEYMKCMSRELFFNCPNDVWTSSPECDEMKSRLERCPNLHPPPHRPFRPRKPIHA